MRKITITHRLKVMVAGLALCVGAGLSSVPAAAAGVALDDVAYEVSNPTKRHSFVTTSRTEATQAAARGFTQVRPIFMVSTTPGAGLTPVYRADATLKDGNFTSLLTVNKREADNACKNGFSCKGIAFYAQADQKNGAEMVYRMKYRHFNFRQVTAKHTAELVRQGYNQEGREWFYVKAVTQQQPGGGNQTPNPGVQPKKEEKPTDNNKAVDAVKDGKFSIAVY